MKKVLPIFILGAGVAAILTVAGVIHLNRTSLQSRPQVTRSEHQRQSTPEYQQQPTSQSKIPEGWQTYRDKELKFAIRYPSKGWSFENGDAHLAESLLSAYPSKKGATLFTTRTPPESMVIVSVAVYQPYFRPLSEWLVQGYTALPFSPVEFDQRVEEVVKLGGDINTALKKAYLGETGILTYRELQNSDVKIYQIGTVPFPGKLSYSTYLTKDSLSVYAITIDFGFTPPDEPHYYDEPDRFYTETYQRIVSSFKFLD